MSQPLWSPTRLFPRLVIVPTQSGPEPNGAALTVFPATIVFWTRRVPLTFAIPPPLPKPEISFSRIVLLVMETWPLEPFHTPPPPVAATFFAIVLLAISTRPRLLTSPPPRQRPAAV